MTIIDKLEWAYYTIKDQLKFGLPEELAIKARERRVSGVLKDAIDELKKEENTALSFLREYTEGYAEHSSTCNFEHKSYTDCNCGATSWAVRVGNYVKEHAR